MTDIISFWNRLKHIFLMSWGFYCKKLVFFWMKEDKGKCFLKMKSEEKAGSISRFLRWFESQENGQLVSLLTFLSFIFSFMMRISSSTRQKTNTWVKRKVFLRFFLFFKSRLSRKRDRWLLIELKRFRVWLVRSGGAPRRVLTSIADRRQWVRNVYDQSVSDIGKKF